MRRSVFAAFSALFLVTTFGVNVYFEGIKEERVALAKTMESLDQVQEQNRSLKADLLQARADIEDLEAENEELKRILDNRRKTYQAAVENRGAVFPILSESGFSSDMFERAWDSYGAAGMKGSGAAFLKAEQETGVNALVLASIAVHETGWGKSALALIKNNYFGWGAYGSNPYKAAYSFSSREEGILTVARSIRDDYLSPAGRYYLGDTLRAMNVRYAADRLWADKVAAVMHLIARSAVVDPKSLTEWP